MLPCCASSTCDVCARDALRIGLEEGTLICPLEECASKNISSEDLIPNRRLRQKASALRQQHPDIFSRKLNIMPVITDKNHKPPSPSKACIPVKKLKETYMTLILPGAGDMCTKQLPRYHATSVQGCERSCDIYDLKSPADSSANVKAKLELEELPHADDPSSRYKAIVNQNCDIEKITSQIKANGLKTHLETHIKCNESECIVKDISISGSSPTTTKNKSEDLPENTQCNNFQMLTTSKAASEEMEFSNKLNDSGSSEPPVPGEETNHDLIRHKSTAHTADYVDKDRVSEGKEDYKSESEEITCSPSDHRKSRPHDGSPFQRHTSVPGSHKVAIPAQYMNEAVEDPLGIYILHLNCPKVIG